MTSPFASGIYLIIGAIFFFGTGFYSAIHWLASNQKKLKHEIQLARKKEKSFQEKSIHEHLNFKRNIDMLKEKTDDYKKKVHKRMGGLKKEVTNLNSVLENCKGRISTLDAELARVQRENILLIKALKTAKKNLNEISALSPKSDEQGRALDLLSAKLKNFDRLRSKNKRLAFRLLEQQIVKAPENSFQEEENFAGRAAKTVPTASQPEALALHAGLGNAFQSMVHRISETYGSFGVVVADELGLLIAGTGEYMDNMAAMAAVYSEVDRKVTPLIPFDKIDAIMIKGFENFTITMQPLNLESEKLILTTLTTGKEPAHSILDQFSQQMITLYRNPQKLS